MSVAEQDSISTMAESLQAVADLADADKLVEASQAAVSSCTMLGLLLGTCGIWPDGLIRGGKQSGQSRLRLAGAVRLFV